MKSTRLASKLPLLLTHDNKDDLINTLWEDKDFCKDVFGIKNPTKRNVIGFFLQLIATKIISFELVNNNALQCVMIKQTTGRYVYEDTYSWLGIEFRSPRRGNAAISLFDTIEAQEKVQGLLRDY